MKDRKVTTSKYGFIIIVFLVIALTCLSFFTSTYNKNSAELNSTVSNLSHNHSDEEKIDSALGLMYIAENNARMYALYNEKTYFDAYTTQLKSVASLIDSLSSNNSNDDNLGELVKDKQLKTQLFLQAQMLVDSLLLKGNVKTINLPRFRHHSLPPLDTSSFVVDTTIASQAPQSKKKKGLFGRLGDALHNRQDSSMTLVDKMLISKFAKDSVKMRYENESLQLQVSDLKGRQHSLDNLKNKEKNVLDANHRLFNNLEDLLQALKRNEVEAQQIRNQALSKNAFSLTHTLKTNNNYVTIFSILLSGVILIILFILYKNELALKKAKVQAENYARLKSEFTATMSHEIRTPLHSIHAFADELNIHNDKAHQSEVIDAIKLSSGMLLSVVNNILDFTKIEKGKFKLEYLPFNPQKVISEILAGVKIQAKQKNLELVGQIDENVNRNVYGDAFQLRQILLNIISNSIKYTEKGNITVKANITQGTENKILLRVQIADTGIGIANKDLPHLFDEFSSNQHQSEVVAGSSGLGLNIVKKMVDLHQGKISVTSELNKGTQFVIELPYDTKPLLSQEIKATQKKNIAPENIKVLLVENDTFNQKFLSNLLSKNNAKVEIANDGESALSLLHKNDYDLILTDIGLPKMSGTE
ncbi:MAG TPA: ATP-binding protein, partial [Arachidicoccus sp.]